MIKLFKFLVAVYFFAISLAFACELEILQLDVDEDWIGVKNQGGEACSGVLDISGNVYSSTSFGKRSISHFILSGGGRITLGNQTGENKIKLSPSLRLSSKGGILELWFNGKRMDFKKWGNSDSTYSSEEHQPHILTEEDVFNGTLKVEEIHPKGDVEYIELVAYGNIKGSIVVKGLGRGDVSKTINITARSGNRVILVDTPQWLSRQDRQEGVYVVYIPGMSLKDKGEELEFFLNDKLMSKIRFSASKDGDSLYFGAQEGERLVFDKVDIPSPALDLQFLKSLKSSFSSRFSGVKCGIKWQHTTPLYGHNSLNLVAQWADKDISNQDSQFKCEWELPNGQRIYKCNPSYISDLGTGLFKIKLTIKNIDNNFYCETFSYVNLPAKPLTPSCREKYYQNLYIHRKEKYRQDIDMSRQCRQQEDKAAKIEDAPLVIDSVLPNPYGKDEGREKMRIRVNRQLSVEGYFVKVGNRRFFLHGLFNSGDVFDIQGDFGLTNYGGCIEIGSGKSIFHKVCYVSSKEGEILSGDRLTFELNENSFVLKALNISKLKIGKSEVCLIYRGKKVKCEPLKYTYQQYRNLLMEKNKLKKEKEKLVKKIDRDRKSFLKKENKLLAKVAALKKKIKRYQNLYYTYKQRSKNNYDKYLKAVRSKNYTIQLLSYRLKLYKNWNKYVVNLFKSEWYPLWKEYDMTTKYKIFVQLDKAISQGEKLIVLKNQILEPREFKKYLEIYYTPRLLFVLEKKKREFLENIKKPLSNFIGYQGQ